VLTGASLARCRTSRPSASSSRATRQVCGTATGYLPIGYLPIGAAATGGGSLADPKLTMQFAGVGSVPKSMTPADFGKFIAEDTEKWGRVIRADNIKAE
jgi:hypothetical protein